MKNHRSIYLELLTQPKVKQLETLMREQNVHEAFKVQSINLEHREDFPFLLLKVEADQIFAAQMMGIFLDLQTMLPECTELYYLPVIVMATNYEKEISEMINVDNSIFHELLHVKDVLALGEDDPTYLDRVLRYSINQLEDPDDLPQSIDLEVFKIFYLEPKAFNSDFQFGEKTIRTRFFGMVLEYECETVEEYISMQISDYLEGLESTYTEAFPDHTDVIKVHTEASIEKYGKEVLDDSPLEHLAKLRKAYPQKLLGGLSIA